MCPPIGYGVFNSLKNQNGPCLNLSIKPYGCTPLWRVVFNSLFSLQFLLIYSTCLVYPFRRLYHGILCKQKLSQIMVHFSSGRTLSDELEKPYLYDMTDIDSYLS